MRGRPKDNVKNEQILQAASDLFLDKGLKATSMDAVAGRAGVSKQTLYSHFKNKDALYQGVILNKLSSYNFTYTIEMTDDREADLQNMGNYLLDLLIDEEVVAMYRIVISEASTFPKISSLFYESGPEQVVEQFTDYFERCDVEEPEYKAELFTTMIQGEWLMKSLMGLQARPPKRELKVHVRRVVKAFMKFL